jgi:hypothetical protein
MFAPAGFGVAPTPWGAVQRAAWETMKHVLVAILVVLGLFLLLDPRHQPVCQFPESFFAQILF